MKGIHSPICRSDWSSREAVGGNEGCQVSR